MSELLDSEAAKLAGYLARGKNLGVSSRAIARAALDGDVSPNSAPYDPADLNRCLLLLKAVPGTRRAFPLLREEYSWRGIIDHWDELEAMFVSEVGENWSEGNSAEKTYDRMKELRKTKGVRIGNLVIETP